MSYLFFFFSRCWLLLPPGVPGRVPDPEHGYPGDCLHQRLGSLRLHPLVGSVPPAPRQARHPGLRRFRGRRALLQMRQHRLSLRQCPSGTRHT